MHCVTKHGIKAKDFAMHKKIAGIAGLQIFWKAIIILIMSCILKLQLFMEMFIKNIPDNPWGYMRYGKLHFIIGDYETAMKSFLEVTKIVPNYYGGWLKFAQSCIALGLNEKAKQAINKALQLNPYDERINALNSLLKNNRRK
jgi:tetratricopeptide (TPR) repeat protein